MKKNIFKTFVALFFIAMIVSCKKEDKLDTDFSKLNIDNPESTEVDDWLTKTFLDEYNMEVIYRYNRFYHGENKDVAAVKIEKIKPQMQTYLEGFLLPYRKIAGTAFIKKYSPKQVVLFGSGSYNDGGYTVATASGGRNITIYDVNNFDLNNADHIVSKAQTIHHEYTHILNQIVPMPADFQLITKSTYRAKWTDKSKETAQAEGYVTPYASSSPIEDFAETTTFLLVYGQVWYDKFANGSTKEGKAALKAKEASVEQYFTANLGIDFRKLQKEIQDYMKSQKVPAVTFGYWLNQGYYKSFMVDLDKDGNYNINGISKEFEEAYKASKINVEKKSPKDNPKFHWIDFRFKSATTMELVISYSWNNGLYGDVYQYNIAINNATGETTFTRVPGGQWLQNEIKPLLDYLKNNKFIADWLPATYNGLYTNYGGFYVEGNPSNYFYGPLVKK